MKRKIYKEVELIYFVISCHALAHAQKHVISSKFVTVAKLQE